MALLRPYKPTRTFVAIFIGIILYFYGFLKNDYMFELIGIVIIAMMYLFQVAGYIMKASANDEKIDPTLWLITLIRIGAIGFVGYVTAAKKGKGLYDSFDNMEDFRFSTFSKSFSLDSSNISCLFSRMRNFLFIRIAIVIVSFYFTKDESKILLDKI